LVPIDEALRAGLLESMKVKSPKTTGSGFYINAKGAVLTTFDAVENCQRITVDRTTEARIIWSDPALGVAVVTPDVPFSPSDFAQFSVAAVAPGTQVISAGYSYGARLPAPVMTYGQFEEAMGLDSQTDIARLSINALPGDFGGPVMDRMGQTLGMLIAPTDKGAKVLPQGVGFMRPTAVLLKALEKAGVEVAQSNEQPALKDDPLPAHAYGITVLVSCWD
jgi:S1-C subfamily serine protease